MLLTLSTRSLLPLCDPGKGENGLPLMDLPEFAISQLQLRGLSVPTSMLAGWSMPELDRLRDRADKAACPCLVLIEDKPLLIGDPDEEAADTVTDRVRMLAVAANRLGCNALGLMIAAKDDDDHFDRVVERIRAIMPDIERHELNVLLLPTDGLTFEPDRLAELIKRIGGFRIGSLPTFQHAARTGNAVETLRKLAPYAGAVLATITGFNQSGQHRDYDLKELVHAIRSVGFLNTLAIDYTGKKDSVAVIEQARTILQDALDTEME